MPFARLVASSLLLALVCPYFGANALGNWNDPNHPFPDSEWSDWTPCTSPCDAGFQARHNCDPSFQLPPLIGQPPFDIQLPSPNCSLVVTSCNQFFCMDPFDWQPFGPCSAQCDGGARVRTTGPNCFVPGYCQREQEIECHTQSCNPLQGCGDADIVFVLDSSNSVGEYMFSAAKQLVIDAIKALKSGTKVTARVAVISYSTTVAVNIDFTSYLEATDIETEIWNIPLMKDTTNTADALRKARMLLKTESSSGVKKIMVVMTDGSSNFQKELIFVEAGLAKQENIITFAVGLGSTEETELLVITQDPNNVLGFTQAMPTITDLATDGICAPFCTGAVVYLPLNDNFKSRGCQRDTARQGGPGQVSRSWESKKWKSGRFHGNDRLTLVFPSAHFVRNFLHAFTVSLWFRWTGGAANTVQGLINNGGGCEAGQSFGISVDSSDSKLYASVKTASGTVVSLGGIPVQTLRWTHVALVYDASAGTLKLYVSEADALSTTVTDRVPQTCDIVFGQQGAEGSGYFTGYIDEIRIFNKAVDDAGIAILSL